jgi:hypothetical protein
MFNKSAMEINKYEKIFNEFYERITPITDKATAFFNNPLKNPHYFSHELLQEMELLHMKLSTALYRLRSGEFQEQLKMKEINLEEFEKLSKELDKMDKLYKHT